jgi:multidrug efflux pump subunit AcrA (membrane-fusion protein)
VVAVLKRTGEAVSAGEPIFRVVDTGRMSVTGHLDVADAWNVREGQAARITIEVGGSDLAVERSTHEGRIIFVDRVVDPEALTCKVVAEVDNAKGELRAGLRARMVISKPEEKVIQVRGKTPATPPVRAPAGPGAPPVDAPRDPQGGGPPRVTRADR